MVFFTCSGCGESLKKNKVQEHLYRCRSCKYVTCMDCNKDFPGTEYNSHVKCISEQEKYGNKVVVNKGEQKQEAWVDQIQGIISNTNTPPDVRGILERIATYSNIPRKFPKFKNFLQTSLNVRNPAMAEKVWKVIEEATKPAMKPAPQANDVTKESNGEVKQDALEPEPSKEVEDGDKPHLSKKERKKMEKMQAKQTLETNPAVIETPENQENQSKLSKKEKKKLEKMQAEIPKSEETIVEEVSKLSKKDRKKLEKIQQESKMVEANGVADLQETQEPKLSKREKKEKRRLENMKVEKKDKQQVEENGGTAENGEAEKGKKKRKRDREEGNGDAKEKKAKFQELEDAVTTETMEVEEETLPAVPEKLKRFKIDAVVTEILQGLEDNTLALKKLKKKVLSEYFSGQYRSKHQMTEDELSVKLMKNLEHSSKFKVHKEKVTLKV